MKIRIGQSRLFDGLKKVLTAANAKNAMPVLGNVKVEAKNGIAALTTTDLDIVLYTELECEVDEEGATTIPVRQFISYVAKLEEGEVAIESDANYAKFKCGSAKAKIATIPADQFPKLPNDTSKSEFTVKGNLFADMIRKTAYAQSVDESRRTLMSVLVETGYNTIKCVATDGRRLAVAENEVEGVMGENQIILPSRAVSIVQKFAESAEDMKVSLLGTQVVFANDSGSSKMYSRLQDAVYPNYNQVIPKNEMNNVVVDRDLFISAIDRASSMDPTGASSVKLTFAEGRLVVNVRCEDQNDSTDEVPIKYDGEKVEALFNPKYVLEPLRAANADEIVFSFTTGSAPAVIKSDSEKFLCVLMPMRIGC